jgi:DNA modification methylase
MDRGKTRRELDGKTWIRYSISVWSDIEKDKEERSLAHPALFPGRLVRRLIEVLTNRGDLVLDPFAGSGSTLIAARALERRSIGLELNRGYIELARERLASQNKKPGDCGLHEPLLLCADARNVKKHVPENGVHLCLTSPPYWNILNEKRTADFKEIRNYGEREKDLSGIADYKEFISALGDIFQAVHGVLALHGYLVVNVMDLRKKAQFYPLHMDLSTELISRGYTLDDIIIWDRRKEYNSLRPLGFPYVFRVNKVHEYLLILQKRADR